MRTVNYPKIAEVKCSPSGKRYVLRAAAPAI
jgi:hypothetical protein